MRSPFGKADLDRLDLLLRSARAVVSMQEVHAGNERSDVIGMRHDVDGAHALDIAVRMAWWEAERGYRSTYFILHSSPYFVRPDTPAKLARIAGCGHEIGFHTNAIAEALRTGRNPNAILDDALSQMRNFWGFQARGFVAHGDRICYDATCESGKVSPQAKFINDEMFTECARPDFGAPDRVLHYKRHTLQLQPESFEDWGFSYNPNWLPHRYYNSDSNGAWAEPFAKTLEDFARGDGQVHLLQHPDWWGGAL